MASTTPIPKLTILVSVFWFAFCVAMFSNTGVSATTFISALLFAGIWGATWVLRLTTYWLRRRFATVDLNDRTHPQHPLIYWALEPTVLVVTLALSLLGIFSFVRFAVSEHALMNYVESVRTGKIDVDFEFFHPPRQVGLYTTSITEVLPDGTVRFITSSDGIFDRAGFANSLSNPPPKQAENSYKHIYGQWWYWYESW